MEKKKSKLKWIIIAILFISIIVVGVIFGIPIITEQQKIESEEVGKINDWEYNPSEYKNNSNSFGGISPSSFSTDAVQSESDSTIGFSTGGAKDIANFRENIKNGYFPISTDITYNGLFYDYYFDTKNANNKSETQSDQLFSPSYSTAVSKDPISNEDEYYMTIGLNSNIKQSDFSRKKLNLVVALDISGSMSSSFDTYYYDKNYNLDKEDYDKEDKNKSKMQIANESVNILIDQLKDDDRFGMVLFDDSGYIAKPLNLVSRTDMASIKEHVLEIEANGGTNFEAGYSLANDLLKEYENVNSNEYENRIIVITDAMPNMGTTSKEGLSKMIEENANKGIYTSFIGVGVDFNTEVIEKLSDTKGANYYSVHSSSEFKDRMGEQFEYMVTPLAFDINLNLSSEDYKIEKVYGSDKADPSTGNLMKVNTLFPSKSSSTGEVKGGVVLLKLKKLKDGGSGKIKLEVSYKDRNEKEFNNSQEITYEANDTEMYENTGIRKAIVLTRYINTIKNWILYERSEDNRFLIEPKIGIIDCDYTNQEVYEILGENERTSQKLTVSEQYKNIFKQIKNYINEQNKILNDDNFDNEIEILDKLINA